VNASMASVSVTTTDSYIPLPDPATLAAGSSVREFLTVGDATALQQLILENPDCRSWNDRLEETVANATGFPHVIATATGNIAISLVLRSIGLRPDDEVIVPANVRLGIIQVIRHFDAHPIPVDVDSESLLLDCNQLADAVSDRTRAIIGSNVGGVTIDPTVPLALAEKHGLLFIEDGHVSMKMVLPRKSLAPIHIRTFHTGTLTGTAIYSGGFICTVNPGVDRRIRGVMPGGDHDPVMADLGHEQTQTIEFVERMTELSAAWQMIASRRSDEARRRRCEVAMSYAASFAGVRELELPYEPADDIPAWCDYLLRLNLHHFGATHNDFVIRLRRRGIRAALPEPPIHLHPWYQELYGFTPNSFPVARNEYLRTVALPIHSRMSDEDLQNVCENVIDVVQEVRNER
jgi:dTDP-4-amino-4,6-dideoxygalactose transaminase